MESFLYPHVGVEGGILPVYRCPSQESNPEPTDPKSHLYFSTLYLEAFKVDIVLKLSEELSIFYIEYTILFPVAVK